MKIYKCMEPQPEIVFWRSASNGGWVASLAPLESISGNGFLRVACPYKIGDEIRVLNGTIVQQSNIEETRKHDGDPEKGTVKSIAPVNRGGFWCWEIEC